MDRETHFVNIRRAARLLGVPLAWLRREIIAGRVPALRAGRQWRVNIDDARRALSQRARREGEGVRDAE